MNVVERERVKELLAQAARLKPQWRKGFIEQAAGDPVIAAEVMELLKTLDDSEFMSAPTGGGLPSPSRAAGPGLEGPGTRIGRYKLLQCIGEGGFGSVFMAEQVEPVVRRVALKIIKAGMDTRQVIARFEAERQALAMMDHPNIARVLDAGATDAGRPYFVMELVRGEPVTRYCDSARLSVKERLALFRDICGAVQHAHLKGIIHRDLKPSNVLVTVADGRPLAKVIDFGIAKATAARLTANTLFTEFHQLIGTPEYMSPEQAEASGVDIDTRSDIYSLGVLLYELLTGSTPFDGRRLRSAPFAEVQRIICQEEPPRPSLRCKTMAASSAQVRIETPQPVDGQARNPFAIEIARMRRTEPMVLTRALRGDLDWIVLRCLEKDRTRRYETASALSDDIGHYLVHEPVAATPPRPGYRLRKHIRRHRVVFLAVAAVALTLIVATGTSIRFGIKASQALSAEASQRKLAEKNAKETEQVADFQQAQLAGFEPARMGKRLYDDLLSEAKSGMERAGLPAAEIARRQDELKSLLADANPSTVALQTLDDNIFQRAISAANEQFKDQPVVRARLLQTLVSTLMTLGLYDRAMPAQTEALALRRQALGDENADSLESLNGLVNLLAHQGRFAEAEIHAREGLATATRVFGADHRNTLTAVGNMVFLAMMQGRREEAEAPSRDLLERSERVLGREDPDTLSVLDNYGALLFESGKLAEAEAIFREEIARKKRALSEDDADTLLAMSNLALMLERQGRLTEAEALYREAFERNRKLRGEDHHYTLLFMSNLGFLLGTLDRAEEGERLTREALERRRRLNGDDNWDSMQSMQNMGVILETLGRYDESEKFFREAIERRRHMLGANHEMTLQSVGSLAVLLRMAGRFDEAETLERETLDNRRRTQGDAHPDTLECIDDMGDLMLARGRPAEAESLFREAIKSGASTLKNGDHRLIAARAGLARSLLALGRAEEAEPILTELEGMPGINELTGPVRRSVAALFVERFEGKDRASPGAGYDRKAAEWRERLGPHSATTQSARS